MILINNEEKSSRVIEPGCFFIIPFSAAYFWSEMKFLTKSVELRLNFARDLVKISSRFPDKAAVFDGLSVIKTHFTDKQAFSSDLPANTSHAEQPGAEFPSELCILRHKKTSAV